jgi:hypothetical protein
MELIHSSIRFDASTCTKDLPDSGIITPGSVEIILNRRIDSWALPGTME